MLNRLTPVIDKGDRLKIQAKQQKDWIMQQIAEKEAKKRLDKEANDLFESQTLEQNAFWTDSENERKKRQRDQERAMMEENQRLAMEKKDKGLREHRELQDAGKYEQDFTLAHDFMTEDRGPMQSMLAEHRYRPDHFKGFSEAEIKKVYDDRARQIADNQVIYILYIYIYI